MLVASGAPSSPGATRWSRFRHHPDAPTLVVGLVIAIGVCFPFFGAGRLFLLDWTIGPHTPIISPAFYGLNGGLTTGVVDSLVMGALNRVLGGPATWLPIVAVFPVAAVGAGRLTGGPRWSRVAAGTLYAVNPFVFNRLFVGHVPLLLGYALLPFATGAALRSPARPWRKWFAVALWWAGLTALSPHFAWIYGVVVVGVVVVSLRQLPWRRVLAWFATSVAAFIALNAYIILPHLVTTLPTQVGQASLGLYQTSSDPHLGLYANVLGLYGFWRLGPGPVLPKDVLSGWPLIGVAILLVVGLGAWSRIRRGHEAAEPKGLAPEVLEGTNVGGGGGGGGESRVLIDPSGGDDSTTGVGPSRPLALVLAFAGVCGYFLALGSQGPTGSLFTFAYDHVPFFAIMREPQKFLMLLALAYAVFFGWGVERLSRLELSASVQRSILTAAAVGVALPLAYTPTIFDGLSGQLALSTLPSAYARANTLMGSGWGKVLYLPWHLYMEYPFTQGRVIGNGGPASFNRPVIAGDNVQSGDVASQSTSPRSAYLEQLFNLSPEIHAFGALVAPLGVKYVVLAKTVDWNSYQWLNHQRDLRLILNTSSLEVWRNTSYDGVGAFSTTLAHVSGVQQLIQLSTTGQFNHGVASTTPATSERPTSPSPQSSSTSTPVTVRQLSPVRYEVYGNASGWVTVDAPYQPGWSTNQRSAKVSSQGITLVHTSAVNILIEFSPWHLAELGYLITLVILLLCIVIFAYKTIGASTSKE